MTEILSINDGFYLFEKLNERLDLINLFLQNIPNYDFSSVNTFIEILSRLKENNYENFLILENKLMNKVQQEIKSSIFTLDLYINKIYPGSI